MITIDNLTNTVKLSAGAWYTTFFEDYGIHLYYFKTTAKFKLVVENKKSKEKPDPEICKEIIRRLKLHEARTILPPKQDHENELVFLLEQ